MKISPWALFSAAACAIVAPVAAAAVGASLAGVGVAAVVGAVTAGITAPILQKFTTAAIDAVERGPGALALLPVAIGVPAIGSQAAGVFAALKIVSAMHLGM